MSLRETPYISRLLSLAVSLTRVQAIYTDILHFPARVLVIQAVEALRLSTDFGVPATSAALADEVHASQVEMPRGLQHVAVVRIDLLKSLLLGARQM